MKHNRPEKLPLARVEQLIVKEVDNEVLVYDLKTDQAHCLNRTAADVWKNCDGEKSLADIRAALAGDSGAAIDEGLVWLALEQLENLKLLEQVPTAPTRFAEMSRRQLIRNLGVAAVALPVIVSIISPTPGQAASPCTNTTTCTVPADCCTAFPTCRPSNKCG